MAISQQHTERLRRRLVSIAGQLLGDIESIEEATHRASSGQGAGEITNVPMHLGDMGTEEYLYQLNSTLLDNEAQLIQDVNEALERIENGTYGTCASCGKAIDPERLDALPATAFCIGCASSGQRHTPNLNEGRPHGPGDTYAPEGDMAQRRHPGPSQFADNEQGFLADGFTDREQPNSDIHAVGTPGGGGASGGLAGSNVGRGDPQVADLEDEMGSGLHSQDPTERLHRPE
jgi:RNA polymerase-binding transcription factor DksA